MGDRKKKSRGNRITQSNSVCNSRFENLSFSSFQGSSETGLHLQSTPTLLGSPIPNYSLTLELNSPAVHSPLLGIIVVLILCTGTAHEMPQCVLF